MKQIIYDLAILNENEVLYYQKQIPNFGFIQMSKDDYEKKFIIKGDQVFKKRR